MRQQSPCTAMEYSNGAAAQGVHHRPRMVSLRADRHLTPTMRLRALVLGAVVLGLATLAGEVDQGLGVQVGEGLAGHAVLLRVVPARSVGRGQLGGGVPAR